MNNENRDNLGEDDLTDIDKITEDVPYTPQRVGHLLHQFVTYYENPEVLELACGYGKITPYLAKAADSRGGKVRASDHKVRTWEDKSAVDRIEDAGLSEVCEFTFGQDARWYTLDLFGDQPGEWVDFVYFDLSHTIEVDAFVALAVWTHLSPGGIIVLDDLDWSPQEHGDDKDESRTSRPEAKQMEILFNYISELPQVGDHQTWGSEEMYWRWGFIQKAREAEADGPVLSQVLENF